jgi:thiamine transport system ATP-binding protein
VKIQKFSTQVADWKLVVDDLDLEAGEVTLVYGPSGSGKTSFFQGLIGVNKSTYILNIDGQNVSVLFPRERGFSVVFQFNNLFEHLSVIENLLLVKPKNMKEQDFVDQLKPFQISQLLNKKASVLSGGEKQMVSCVRAFVHQGRKVLLLDEPWSSMDFDSKAQYRMHLIKYLKQSRTPCLLISHDKDEEISSLNPKFIFDFTQIARFEKGQLEGL